VCCGLAAGIFHTPTIERQLKGTHAMFANTFAPQLSLRESSRIPSISRSAGISVAELACLLAFGALATAAVGLLHISIRLPGHAILRGALPMAMGLAFVPRRWSGIIMSIGAGAAATAMSAAQVGSFPATAMLSILALGPVLDLAFLGSATGWRIYARFAIAGALANLLALALRVAGIQLSIEMGSGGQFLRFSWPVILASYVACGALAGLIGAAACFRARVAR
jgi:hypothetical protein